MRSWEGGLLSQKASGRGQGRAKTAGGEGRIALEAFRGQADGSFTLGGRRDSDGPAGVEERPAAVASFDVFKRRAVLFRALGDATRLKILALLRVRPLCVCELVPLLGISQSAISQHMRRLREAGLVAGERRGQWVVYRLNDALPAPFVCLLKDLPDMSDEIGRLMSGVAAPVCRR
ncbi:metalloregulator ArsR/SmtB family transcription factor [Hydrogenibacillus sp. N12]|uniref:ArsR/SmtB family transcription factor n=1 Tax=Hydrogenibacillus sp. N12 TaxID=2866627 RepID=UPI001C7DDB9C|nr:metalloregulator ArsR/SmtB family transcription factor [Hydrogenibacillus sp. N12]QZA33593.1 metalloregulator ArsR/SmtB family transcription factor [Hydrogenibacillus sp. N12]